MFHPIDPDRWERSEHYEHYMHTARCTYSMTVEIDITRLYAAVKARGLRLTPALIYLSARAVNSIENLRFDRDEQGRVGYHDVSHPSYTVFHPESRLFSVLWSEYSPHFPTFCAGVLRDVERWGGCRELFPQRETPRNVHDFSAIPWAGFSAFNLNLYTSGDHLAPIITCGRFREEGGKKLLPLAIQLHHAVADGWHAAEYFRIVQELAGTPEEWMEPDRA